MLEPRFAIVNSCFALFHYLRNGHRAILATAQKLAKPLHGAILKRLTAGDQDQEVKDAAISAAATELALLGDALSAELPEALQVCAPCSCADWRSLQARQHGEHQCPGSTLSEERR